MGMAVGDEAQKVDEMQKEQRASNHEEETPRRGKARIVSKMSKCDRI